MPRIGKKISDLLKRASNMVCKSFGVCLNDEKVTIVGGFTGLGFAAGCVYGNFVEALRVVYYQCNSL